MRAVDIIIEDLVEAATIGLTVIQDNPNMVDLANQIREALRQAEEYLR